jgi:four helix bundle protein
MKIYFDHEKLDVYREAIDFCGWVGEFLATISANTTAKDRARFLEMARGSALECAACLDVLFMRKLASETQVAEQKERLARIVQMLIGLLRKFSERAEVLREDEAAYFIEHEREHE